MDTAAVEEVLACLPAGRTLFPYYKDRYALMLLANAAGNGIGVAELKRRRIGALLGRPAVREVLARCGDGRLRADDLHGHWPAGHEQFLLTASRWGCGPHDREARLAWWQTSRPGWNLVLQLNFSTAYEQALAACLDGSRDPLGVNFPLHPVRIRGRDRFYRQTLAWARIDLEFDDDVALIEEVQSDWIRWVGDALERWLASREGGDPTSRRGEAAVRTFLEERLPHYRALWQEAMLAATIAFIRDELGIRTVYFHTPQSNRVVKGLSGSGEAPRSIYTALPRRFCFERTAEGPVFIERAREQRYRRAARRRARAPGGDHAPEWHRLTLH